MERCGSEIGECVSGRQLCTADGAWGRCEEAVDPAASDLCDGRDEDCDGMTDEGAACPFGGVCHEGACIDPVPAPVPMNGGCGCAVPGEERGPLPIAATLLFAALVALRLRRRR
jgi:MYXO-CTERM domain-containing protein